MLIKVCGITNNGDISAVMALEPDYMGFIFYPPSPRDVSGTIGQLSLSSIPGNVKKVGVMVDEDEERAEELVKKYKFEAIQLHGNESPDYCARLKKLCEVIKAFRINDRLPSEISLYEGKCDLFLFDTAAARPGGTGKKFDHRVLNGYICKTPYLLSGGIGPPDAEYITGLRMNGMAGVDLNSRFEISPGIKSPVALEKFINECRNIKR